MKASTKKGIIYIEANWNQGDILRTEKVAQWMCDNRGYVLIDGSDNREEYYVGLGHNETAKEAMEDYRDAKMGVI